MAAALHHAAVVEDNNLVGVDHGGQPVRDGERGAVLRHAPQRGLDIDLGAGVERAGGLVEDQNARFFRIVRAIATRCFSRPTVFRPRSPTRVS